MRKILPFALVLLPALPALAGGRTINLSTLVDHGKTKLKSGETQITVRAPRSNKISRSLAGAAGPYVPLSGHLNAAGTKLLFKLEAGKYYASPADARFSIKK